jgi:hypothetical protein
LFSCLVALIHTGPPYASRGWISHKYFVYRALWLKPQLRLADFASLNMIFIHLSATAFCAP